MLDQQVNNLVAHLFRHEAGKMAAVLTRLFGFQCLEKAEDIVQETLLQAMSTWPLKGVPENPSAWYTLWPSARRLTQSGSENFTITIIPGLAGLSSQSGY